MARSGLTVPSNRRGRLSSALCIQIFVQPDLSKLGAKIATRRGQELHVGCVKHLLIRQRIGENLDRATDHDTSPTHRNERHGERTNASCRNSGRRHIRLPPCGCRLLFCQCDNTFRASSSQQNALRGRTKFCNGFNGIWPVQPFATKYSAFVAGQITRITPRVSRRMRGVGHRHERAVRCDGRRWRARRTRRTRTVKSCGSGAAVLALSPREAKLLGGDGGKRAVLRGEHEVSRKAIAQGRPECSAEPVCSCARSYAQIARETAGAACTRSSLRPLIRWRANEDANLGRNASRDREVISTSLRAQRSNPRLRLPHYGLLRCARNDGGNGRAPTAGVAVPLPTFSPQPFPLRPKTLYGAPCFAFGEIEIMINIKGLAQG